MAMHDIGTYVVHHRSEDWRDAAACVGRARDVNFFPERGESVRGAKAVCAACPVREPCLDFALRINVSEGVWGGLAGHERRVLRRRLARARVTL
jgi:WhiB family redox-sensing transcriptional regulator